jgi:D-3-phosphoglycerate dehydrogenase / 2-oxoglutarate reductase
VITDSQAMLEAAVATLEQAHVSYELLPEGLEPDEVAIRSADADVAIVTFVPFQRPAIMSLRRIGLIVRCGVGVDLIDIDAATERGIWVANVPDYAVHDVADHTMLLLLSAVRHLNHLQRSWPAKGWGAVDYPEIRRLGGRRLGIVGLGRIGSQVALRARAFGMEVVANSPHITEAQLKELGVKGLPLDELLVTSDVISLHTPLTPQTRHLLNESAFSKMKRGVVIVNTARGGLIDLTALQAAIDRRIVGAVALDVLDREPFPDLTMPFLHNSNVTITPHVAWYSREAVRDLGVLAAEEALRYLRGEPLRAVLNPEARSVRPRT